MHAFRLWGVTALCGILCACAQGITPPEQPTEMAPTGGAAPAAAQPAIPSFEEAVSDLLAPVAGGQTVAVVQFTDSSGRQSQLADEMRQRVEPLVFNQGRAQGLKFLERHDLKLIMDEWKLDMSGLVQGDEGARSLLGADLILTGRVSLEPPEVLVSLKLMRLADGQIVSVAEGARPAEPVFFQWNSPPAQAAPENAPAAASQAGAYRSASEDGNLHLWADTGTYRVGDKLVVYFEVFKPLYVSVIDVTPAGEKTALFPNPYQTDFFCRPGKIYRIPPADAPFSLEITGPAGKDRIKALASSVPFQPEALVDTRGVKFTEGLVNTAASRAVISIAIQEGH